MIIENFVPFLDKFFEEIERTGIDITGLPLDHVAFRTESEEDFERLKPEAEKLGKLVHNNYVSGNQVNIYELYEPLQYKDYSISVLELIGPHDEKKYKTGFEHAEFVIVEDFEKFAEKYPDLDWNKTSINRSEFPMIKLQLNEFMQVKFIKVPALEMVKQLSGE